MPKPRPQATPPVPATTGRTDHSQGISTAVGRGWGGRPSTPPGEAADPRPLAGEDLDGVLDEARVQPVAVAGHHHLDIEGLKPRHGFGPGG